MQTRISEFEKGMVTLETELSSTKTAFEETKAKEEEIRLEFQRAVDDKNAVEVALADAKKSREEELETLREAKHAAIAEKVQLGNKVEILEADLAAKREDLKTMLAETSEVHMAYMKRNNISSLVILKMKDENLRSSHWSQVFYSRHEESIKTEQEKSVILH